jgi:hypothetical protein
LGEREERENLYLRRLRREIEIPEEELISRMNWDRPLLSENYKCSVSLDLPVLNCKPTRVCSEVCYACQGRQCYRKAIVKSIAVNQLVNEDPEHASWKFHREARDRTIRIAGSGELLPQQAEALQYLERYGGTWWGFTKRIDTFKALPSMMFSLDASSPESVLKFVKENVPPNRRSYISRPGDSAPPLKVAVTFPVHGTITNYAVQIPVRETDCPACRGWVEGCWQCKRCY